MRTKSQASINEDIKCKRDVLDIIKHTNDKLSRKDIVLALSVRNGGKTGYSYNRIVKALQTLVKEGVITKHWAWGVAGNWEHRYTFNEEQS